MEFVVRSTDLLKEMISVQGVIERKTTLPILANVRLEAREGKKGGEVEIVATDLDVWIRTACAASVGRAGVTTLPGRRLHDILRLLPDAEVDVRVKDGGWANVACERTRYRLAAAGADDFPQFPAADGKDALTLPLEALRGMIKRVIFAISAEDPRYAMKGALFTIEKGRMSLAATDGHRLALISRAADVPAGAQVKALIPRKTLVELEKTEAGPEGEVRFAQQGNHLLFRMGKRQLQSNTLEGEFPAYERVLPQKNDRIVTVPTGAFLQALQRVALLSQERHQIRLALQPGKLIVSTQNPDMGEAEETVTADYDGAELQMGFNSDFLVQFLQEAGTDRVRLELKDEQTQGLLRPDSDSGGEEFDYRYVVMPMRLS